MFRHHLLRGVSAGALFVVCSAAILPAMAQEALPTIDIAGEGQPAQSRRPAPATTSVWSPTLPDGKPAFVEKFQLPNTVASVTRKDIEEKLNIIDTEDVVKYMPSLSIRKRNNGETQAVLQTRTWGYGSSARSLVYADDLLLSALVGNDNSIGAPRWGLVSPEEIERVDFLYGPFSAAYSGNSIGGVLQITTRMPEKLEVTAKQTQSLQDFSLYGTSKLFHTEVTSVTVGDKVGDFSWFFAGNFAHGTTQPLTYVTTGNATNYIGSWWAQTKFGVPNNVVGSAGNLENDQINAKLKLAYDITPTVRAAYTVGFWSDDGTSKPENYLAPGYDAFAASPALPASALSGFGSAYYRIQEQMLTNALSVKSNTHGVFDWELSASHFTYLNSAQVSPNTAVSPFGYSSTGKVAVNTGTYWTLLDLKGILRPEGDGLLHGHEVSFGLHGDQYHLNNPTYLTTSWPSGLSASTGVASSIGDGTTRTQALWVQDAWKFAPDFKLTVGVRGEHWQASDGYNQALSGLNALGTSATGNLASTLPIYQKNLYHTRFSPKGSLQWTPDSDWTVTGSIGLANRFPTAKELYNLTSLSSTGQNINPNPNLLPEVALSSELAIERKLGTDGEARLSFFDEEVRDAMISQSTYAAGTNVLTSATVNVDRVRNRGIEFAARKDNVLIHGFELSGSATFLDSRVLADSRWVPTAAYPWDTSVVGKNVPSIPKWRWTATATYRPDDHWAFTVGARWQSRFWTTLDNNDVASGVYQGFDRFFVVDTKIHYRWNSHVSLDFGIDNIGNYKYFLFHPFPQRTFVFSGKYEFGREKGEHGIFFEGNEPSLFDGFKVAFQK